MIRPATNADIPAIVRLSATMHSESRYRSLPFNGIKWAEMLRHLIAAPESMVAVAEVHGEVIGAIAGIITDHYFADTRIAYEFGLYVAPEHRGGRSGYQLAKEYIEWAKSCGVEQIDMGITTGIHTERTGALYERLGLVNVGVVYSFGG